MPDINSKRIKIRLVNDGGGHFDVMTEHDPAGDYVEFHDYKALSSETSALKHNIDYYREQLDAIQKVLGWKRAKDFISRDLDSEKHEKPHL